MGRRAVLTVLWLAWCSFQSGFSQTQNPPDPGVYLSFFRQVARLERVSGPVLVNGQPSDLRQPTVQETLGLTETEAQILSALAADCELKSRPLDSAARLSTFEARLLAIASEGGASTSGTQQRKNLDRQLDEMVGEHIQQLKAELGDSRFEAMDGYIRSKRTGASFFPPVPAQGGPPPRVAHKR
jgi:hypothetical protein